MPAFPFQRIVQLACAALLQGGLVVLVPMTGLQAGQQDVPENYEEYANPAMQGVIIEENVPWPAVVPVPPPVPTPVRNESSQLR